MMIFQLSPLLCALLDVRLAPSPRTVAPRAAARMQVSSHDITGDGKAVFKHPEVAHAAESVKDLLQGSSSMASYDAALRTQLDLVAELRSDLRDADAKVALLEGNLQAAARKLEQLNREVDNEKELRSSVEMRLWMLEDAAAGLGVEDLGRASVTAASHAVGLTADAFVTFQRVATFGAKLPARSFGVIAGAFANCLRRMDRAAVEMHKRRQDVPESWARDSSMWQRDNLPPITGGDFR